jgi:hypothetical protein
MEGLCCGRNRADSQLKLSAIHNTSIIKGSESMSVSCTEGQEPVCLPPPSPEAAQRWFERVAQRQAACSTDQLCARQAALLGPQGLLSVFSRQVAVQGRQAPALGDLPEIDDPQRQRLAEQAVSFVLAHHRRRAAVGNPFVGLSRQSLCCMLFDDEVHYTLAERFAVSEALRQRDSRYFSTLIATTRDTVERRLVFTGLLEHFDSLLPIEQSIYPEGYRQAQQQHLDREEALYGKLRLERPVGQLLEAHSAEWLLANLCAVNASTERDSA